MTTLRIAWAHSLCLNVLVNGKVSSDITNHRTPTPSGFTMLAKHWGGRVVEPPASLGGKREIADSESYGCGR